MTNAHVVAVQTWVLITQTVVLVTTAAIALWYAHETQQMKKEMVHQTQLNLRPFVKPVIWHDMTTLKPRIKLKNIGSGIAVNIMIEALVMAHDNRRYWRHEFDQVTALAVGEEAEVMYDFYSGTRPSSHPPANATGEEMEAKLGSFPAGSLVIAPSHPNAYINPFPMVGGTQTLTIVFEDAEDGIYQLQAYVYPLEKSNRERQVKLGHIQKRTRPDKPGNLFPKAKVKE